MKTKEIWGTVWQNLEVSQYDILIKAREIIKEVFNLKNVDSIKNGRMVEMVEHATSHSWIDEEDRGVPTEQQKQALVALEVLKEAKNLLSKDEK